MSTSTVNGTQRSTMRAAVIVEPGHVDVRTIPIIRPGSGQVRVRLEGCGVCASNLPPWEGKPWFTYPMEPGALGHEGWGVIDQVGPGVSEFAEGQRVAFLGLHSYADFDVVDPGSIVALPAELDREAFPAEPLGCAINIFRRSGIERGQTVAIVGIGFLGALLTELASRAGARVIAVARRPFSLDVARAKGADETIPMDDHHAIISRVGELTGGRFCDVVVEAVGKQWPLDLAAEITRERGRLIVAGYHQDGQRQINMQLWNWRGLDVINAHERDPRLYLDGMRRAVKMVSEGLLNPRPLFTHKFSLEHLGDALNATRDRPDGFFKALVVMQ
jgi:threonine dehydrogenase-like Zn-dependent dehydrogenase